MTKLTHQRKKFKKVIIILLSCIGILIILATGTLYGIFFNEINALVSFKKLDDSLFFMRYNNDYFFDDFLQEGAASDSDLAAFIIKKLMRGVAVELVAPDFACSVFTAATPQGERIFARNYDWDYSPALIVKTKPKNGYASISTVDLYTLGFSIDNAPSSIQDQFLCLAAPYVPLDGVNEKGVAIAVNMLNGDQIAQERGKTPITTTTLIRLVLDKAASVEEAITLIDNYDLHDSTGGPFHFQIADKSGSSAIIEYIDNQMQVIKGDSPYQHMTNFALSLEPSPESFGMDRFAILQQELQESKGILTQDAAMNLLSKVEMGWMNPDIEGGTVWSAVYNLNTLSVQYAFQGEYKNILSLKLD
ncbi:MAG: C45 family peptidase [Clostridia bacterium]